jgi:hypothetical protein
MDADHEGLRRGRRSPQGQRHYRQIQEEEEGSPMIASLDWPFILSCAAMVFSINVMSWLAFNIIKQLWEDWK